MNKIYRVIWSAVHRTWIAVSEIAQSQGKSRRGGSVVDASSAKILAVTGSPATLTSLRLSVLTVVMIGVFGSSAWAVGAAGGSGTCGGDTLSDLACGSNSKASGGGGMAIGTGSTAIGYASTASGSYSMAIGTYTTASGSFSTASGSYSTASGSFSKASNTGSIALGGETDQQQLRQQTELVASRSVVMMELVMALSLIMTMISL